MSGQIAPEEKSPKTWQPTELSPRHHEMKRLMLMGLSNKDIGKRLGCTPQLVCNVRNSKVMKEALAKLQDKADEDIINTKNRLEALEELATDVYESILTASPEEGVPWHTKAHVADKVLDRTGHSAPQQNLHLHGHFTADDLQDIKRRAKNLKVAGEVLMVEDEED